MTNQFKAAIILVAALMFYSLNKLTNCVRIWYIFINVYYKYNFYKVNVFTFHSVKDMIY